MKKRYIDLMEKTLSAYSTEHIERYFAQVKRDGLSEHGFPRLTANIGILISYGRRTDLTGIFTEMMDFCCESVPRVKAANDFSVKELVFCIMALEERGGADKAKTDYWRACLATIEPRKCYNVYAKTPNDKVHNWALFSAVSEHMRQYIGLCDSSEFIDIQLPSQLQWLDENGMYRDPNNPIVYDLVPRGLFSVLLHFGYDGKWRDEIDACLRRTGVLTLKMQSVSGEIPFGGRSNQFLHNEAHFAIIAEYEAKRYAREGNMKLAAEFKRGVDKALSCIEGWLEKRPIRHIKNCFPTETKYGCEDYAYFDKYMITTASFLYAASLISDPSIPVSEVDDGAPYAFTLSADFHKVFMKAGGYFLEFDTDADPHYDCSGLGRVHKEGAPTAVCMSLPCAKRPVTVIDIENASDISLSAGYGRDGTLTFATDGAAYEVISLDSDERSARARIKNAFDSGKTLFTDYGLDESGVRIKVTGENEVAYMLPAFDFDGANSTKISAGEKTLEIEYEGWVCRYTTDGQIADTGMLGCNRNGHYRAFCATGNRSLSVRIVIEKL